MATAEQVQNCKKILHDEIGQIDGVDELFDELLEVMNKIRPFMSFDGLSLNPEFVAFLQSKNQPTELLGYLALHLDPGLSTFEDAFKEGLRLGQEFGRKKCDGE